MSVKTNIIDSTLLGSLATTSKFLQDKDGAYQWDGQANFAF